MTGHVHGGKDAIRFVFAQSEGETRRIYYDPLTSNTLQQVCAWRLFDPQGWKALLRDLGLLRPYRQ